jgi:hypothetical protein
VNNVATGLRSKYGIGPRRTALFLALFASSIGCALYDLTELSYDPTIGHDGTFFFYEAKSDTARRDRPAILAIHGGGFRAGDKAAG